MYLFQASAESATLAEANFIREDSNHNRNQKFKAGKIRNNQKREPQIPGNKSYKGCHNCGSKKHKRLIDPKAMLLKMEMTKMVVSLSIRKEKGHLRKAVSKI